MSTEVVSSEGISAEVKRVFDAQAAKRWELATSTAADRIARLNKLRQAIVDHREALAAAVYADFRKSATEFEMTEVSLALDEIDHITEHLAEWMEPQVASAPAVLNGTRSMIRHEPLGKVLIISPWNYPFNLLFIPLIDAIAAGNTVMLKPSQKTSHHAEEAARLIRATFPEDEVAIYTGGHDVSDAMVELPFDHLLFTGSPPIGKQMMASASKHLTTVTLELGGKSPVILDPSADIEAAARRVLWGKCLNAGQTCIAPDHVLAHESVVEDFVNAAKATIEKLYGDTPEARMASPDFPRIIVDRAWDRVTGLISHSVDQGAHIAFGGASDRATRYIEPTVLTDVTPEMPIMGEEIFGPVLPIVAVKSTEEACAFVRSGEKPLALYAFADDPKAAEYILSHTTSGGSVVNHVFLHAFNPSIPFGGVGNSGMGNYHGVHGFRTFSHARGVVDVGKTEVPMPHAPYADSAKSGD